VRIRRGERQQLLHAQRRPAPRPAARPPLVGRLRDRRDLHPEMRASRMSET